MITVTRKFFGNHVHPSEVYEPKLDEGNACFSCTAKRCKGVLCESYKNEKRRMKEEGK